jgi:hypothetical protein
MRDLSGVALRLRADLVRQFPGAQFSVRLSPKQDGGVSLVIACVSGEANQDAVRRRAEKWLRERSGQNFGEINWE